MEILSVLTIGAAKSVRGAPQFSASEIALFERRYDEGYNLETDDRYLLWKKMYHPESPVDVSGLDLSLPPLSPLSPLVKVKVNVHITMFL